MNEKFVEAEQKVSTYLGKFFEMIGESPELQVEPKKPDELYVNLQGRSNFFSEDKEELAKSLSILVQVLLERQCGLEKDVQVDINGVKLTRRRNLEKFALDAAEQAKKNERKVRLNPMSPVERKWVHIALSETEGVETYSVGQGGERRVIIKPEK